VPKKQKPRTESSHIGSRKKEPEVREALTVELKEAARELALDRGASAAARSSIMRTLLDHFGGETSVMKPVSEMSAREIDEEIARLRPLTASRK
jgi:hypothetical protein